MADKPALGRRLETLGRRLSTPRAIGITIPLLVLLTGFLVAFAGRTALTTTIDVFAEARLGDQAASLVAYLDQSLSEVDPVLTGIERSMQRGIGDLELALGSRLIDRPWLRWLALRLEGGIVAGAARLPEGGYEFALQHSDGTQRSWRVKPDGSRELTATTQHLPLDSEAVAWQAVRSDRPGWFWTETMAYDQEPRSLIIGRIHRTVIDGNRVVAGAGVDLRLVPGLQRKEVLGEGLVAIALLDEQGRVLLERDRVPDPEESAFGLADPALRAASALMAGERMEVGSQVLEVDGVPVRAMARRLPSRIGSELTVVAVADEAELRGPAAGYLLHSIVIEIAATAVAVAIATLYGSRVVRVQRQLRAQRRRAEAAEQLVDELGTYRLIELVGKGGMGEVWSAEHRLLARPAAVKLLSNLEGDPVRVHERFMREAQMTAALRCPHTVQIYDFGTTTDGRPYYAMELLEGIDLETLVLNHGALRPPRVVSILIQICDSLAEAHDHGLVHRDIKPSNVLLCRIADHCDYVKVLDFGILAMRHAPDDGSDEHGQSLTAGTPGFMAPEQAAGDPLDGRADIYALGCIAWWLSSGRPVFAMTGTSNDVIERHACDPLPPLRTRETIPFVLEDLIRRCLSKDAAGRPADARSLGRALKACFHLMDDWTEDDARAWWEQHLPYGPDSSPTIPGSSPSQESAPVFADTRTQTLVVTSFAWRPCHSRSGRRPYTPTR